MLKVGNLKLVSDTLEQEKSLRGKIKKHQEFQKNLLKHRAASAVWGASPGFQESYVTRRECLHASAECRNIRWLRVRTPKRVVTATIEFMEHSAESLHYSVETSQ